MDDLGIFETFLHEKSHFDFKSHMLFKNKELC